MITLSCIGLIDTDSVNPYSTVRGVPISSESRMQVVCNTQWIGCGDHRDCGVQAIGCVGAETGSGVGNYFAVDG